MARTKDPHVEARNKRLIEDAERNPFQSYADMGRTYGMAEQMVYRVLSEAGLVSSERRKPRVLMGDRKGISNVHVFVGIEIKNHYRLSAAITDEERNIGDLARALAMSPQRVSAITKGVDDLTLSELMKIAAWLGKPLGELLTTCEKKAQAFQLPGKQSGSFG